MFNIQSNSFICHSAFLRHTICCASAQADLLNHSRWTFCMTLREYPFRYESKKIFLPDLESLKTDTTWRRKLVSCSALLVFWFLGVISSWHHSGPNALKEIHNKVQSCFELSEINVKLKYKNCKFNQIFPGKLWIWIWKFNNNNMEIMQPNKMRMSKIQVNNYTYAILYKPSQSICYTI